MSASLSTPSSDATYLSDTEEESGLQVKKTLGPSLSKIIVIKRLAPDEKIMFYRTITNFQDEKFLDPTSFKTRNYEFIKKKYSKMNKTVKDHLEDSLTENFGKLAISEFSEILTCEKSDEIFSRLFIASAYAIENYFGKPGPESAVSNDLYLYIHNFFLSSKGKENANFEMAKQITPPEFWIKVYVMEASGFRNGNDLGHVYCKAWISSESNLVEMTNIVQRTNHPVWNVRFFFALKSLRADVINIEIRGSGIESASDDSLRSSIKDALTKKFFGKSTCEDLKPENFELVGKVEIKVCDVYSEGVDEWIPLINNRSENEEIFLHLRIRFGVFEPEIRSRGIKRHLLLLRTCFESGLANRGEDEKITNWEALLDRSALTLIFLHGVIAHLSESEDALCRFVIITNLGIKTESLSYELLYNLLSETVEHLKQFPDERIDNRLRLIYDEELQNLHDFCFSFSSSFQFYDVLGNKRMFSDIEFCLKNMYLFQSILDSAAAPLMTLKSGAVSWFEKKSEEMKVEVPQNRASYIKNFLDNLLEYQKVLDQIIGKIFSGETYTHLTYKQLDETLSKPLKCHISEFSHKYVESECTSDDEELAAEDGIKIFSKMKKLLFYVSKTVNVPPLTLNMGEFQQWFDKSAIIRWFECRRMKARQEIEKAVTSDNLETLDDANSMASFKASTSARQACDIILRSLEDLWILVSFPRSAICDKLFVSNLQSCCAAYGVLLMSLIATRELVEEFHSGGRKCLWVLSNNIWFTIVFAEKTILDTVGKLPPNFSKFKSDLEEFCQEVCSSIADRYLTNVDDILKKIFENQLSGSGNDLTEFNDYMRKIIWEEVSVESSFDVFVMFLKNMSNGLIKVLKQIIENNEALLEDSAKASEYFSLLKHVLEEAKEICSIPDKPDENRLIWNENYSDFLLDLDKKIEY